MQLLAELEVYVLGPVGVVEHDERGRLAFDEGGFQNVLRVFDGIAGVHRGVVGHVGRRLDAGELDHV